MITETILNLFRAYVATDRLNALAGGQTLTDRTSGTALLADISGFTPLTEALVTIWGAQRAVETLSNILNRLYTVLIAEVERYGGSVVGFSGDAITCWFAADLGERALAAALAMQAAVQPIADQVGADKSAGSIAIKVALVSGSARRFLVGDPEKHLLDILAGKLLEQLGNIQRAAQRGEVVMDLPTYQALGPYVASFRSRRHTDTGEELIVVEGLSLPVAACPWPPLADDRIAPDQLRHWLPPQVAARLENSPAELFAELRPAVALMLAFGGIEYDTDAEAPERLDHFVRWVQAVLTRYEGLLVDITMSDLGSYLYCAFGAPVAHDDDATRAVSAAMELQALPPDLGFVKGIRIGIAAGLARVGAYGSPNRRSYGVLGRAANMAARLMQHAVAGAILVDESIARLAENRWYFAALPAVRIKGRAEPIPLYQPIGLRVAADAPRSTLVGRERELGLLLAALERLRDGRTTTVLIEGEAGIGKSRLLRAFVQSAQQQGIRVLQGAGQSIAAQMPYRTWRDILEDYFEVAYIPDPQQRQEQVGAALATLRPELVERLPLLNNILGLKAPDTPLTRGLDANLRNESLIDLLTQLLLVRAQTEPLALVLEDAQWLDRGSWELVLRVTRFLHAAAAPLLLLLAVRTGDNATKNHPNLSLLLELPHSLRLSLNRLALAQVTMLVAGRLGVVVDDVPVALVELVNTHADGNPLFVEELITTICEQQLVRIVPHMPVGQRVIMHHDFQPTNLTLPATLQGLLLARIDRLSTETQLTLKVAAVLGTVFPFALLRHLRRLYSAADELTLRQQLALLVSTDFMEHRHDDPQQRYQFKHVLVREAAYQTLLFTQRRELHLAAAHWYEQSDDLALLVHHYHHAEERDRERHYAQLAGIQAADQYANADAIAYFGRALSLTAEEDHVRRFELLCARTEVYNLKGDRAAEEADLVLLAQLAEQLDDDARRAQVLLRRADYALAVADYEATLAAAQQVVALTPSVSLEAAQAHATWGWALLFRAEFAAARRQLERALALARASDWQNIEADTLNGIGLAVQLQGNFAQAEQYHRQALAINRALGNRRGQSAVLTNLGNTAFYLGNYTAAQEFYSQDLALVRSIGDQANESISWLNLGELAIAKGELTAAQSAFEHALRLARATNSRATEGHVLAGFGAVALRLIGDYASACAWLEQALQIANEVDNQQGALWPLNLLGWLQHQEGDAERALSYCRQALDLARRLGDTTAQSMSWCILGQIMARGEQQEEAIAAYEQAILLAEGLGTPVLRVEALAGLTELMLQSCHLDRALAYTNQVLAHIRQHGLDGTREPARIYLICYRVLRANGDPRAPDILHAAYTFIQQRAGQLTNAGQRDLYFIQIAAHNEIKREFEQ